MIVAVETLFLTALLSAFIGIVAFLAFASPQARGSTTMRGALAGLVVAASVAALGSFFLYAVSPHEQARQTVYGGEP
jgi:ABC-type Fe3+-siderophore transport system permease subunit